MMWTEESPMDIWEKSLRDAEQRNRATNSVAQKLNLVASDSTQVYSNLNKIASKMTTCCIPTPIPTAYRAYKSQQRMIDEEEKKMNTMNNMTNDLMNNVYNGVFGRVAPDLCRISMGGNIAIKTKSGYKSYNVKTGRLTNCSSFAFNIGDEAFFVLPTSHVEEGDIIMVGGYPHCVISTSKNRIEAFCYEDSSVHTIVPEHHVFMGKSYLYGKIVSMFGDIGKSNGMKKMMHFMMLSQMMNRSGSGNGGNGAMDMLPMMMLMGGGSGSILDGMFDFDEDTEDDISEEDDSEEEA